MDDGDRCLLDVISDPLALEFFLGSGDELKSNVRGDEHVQVPHSYVVKKAHAQTPSENQKPALSSSSPVSSSPAFNPNAAVKGSPVPPPFSKQSASQHIAQLPNYGPPTPSPSGPSSFQAPAPSPIAATPSPSITAVAKSPMPPPSPSPGSVHRSPAQAQVHSMHCPSPSGYPVTQSPSMVSQNHYQVRSPASSPLPTAAFVQARAHTPVSSMAPATIGIIQQHHPQTQPQSVRSPATIAAPPVLSNATLQSAIPVGGQIMQFIQAPVPPPQGPMVRHQHSNVKPIQPKQPQQILPKPAGGAPAPQSYGKSVALAPRGTPMSLATSQASPLVLGQGQAMLPNSANVTVGPQGTLVLNHISLGVGQSPILIPGAHGLPSNVQLLVRTPQAHTTANTSQVTTPGVASAALLAALQVQNPAAQQAFFGQAKAIPGQGQAMVIPGQNLGAAQQQLAGQALRPGIIGGPRMVSHHQMAQPQASPLVLQQIQTPQGPITVAISSTQLQALQSCGLGLGSPGLTLANPSPTGAGLGHIGGVIQGQPFQGTVAPSLPQSLVLNSQPVPSAALTQTAAQATTLVSAFGDPSNASQLTQMSQLHPLPPQQTLPQQPQVHSEQQQQPTVQQPQSAPHKPQSVNLEELLKQAGIMPDDAPPSPPPPPPPALLQPQPMQAMSLSSQTVEQFQPVVTFASMAPVPVMTKQCLATVNGQQTVVVNHDAAAAAAAQSQLIAQLQQPLMTTQHLQSQGAMQTQVKLALAQDGSFYIQRPVFSSTGPSLAMAPQHQPQASLVPQHHMSIPMASLGTVTSTVPTSSVNVSTTMAPQPIHSVLLQRLNTTTAQQMPPPGMHNQLVSAAPDQTAILPLTMQGVSMGMVSSSGMIQPAITGVATTTMTLPVVTSASRATAVVVSSANTILGSMLSQSHPTLTQTLVHDAASAIDSTKNYIANSRAAVIQQNPLLVQSLQGMGSSAGQTSSIAQTLTSSSVGCVHSATMPVSSAASPVFSAAAVPSASIAMSTAATTAAATNTTTTTTTTGTVAKPVCSSAQQQQQQVPTSGLIVAGYPITGLQPGHKVQTIQLTPQLQEALQKIQVQLHSIRQKPHSPQQWQQIQQLQNEQQKILAQGKVISVQQQPAVSQPVTQTIRHQSHHHHHSHPPSSRKSRATAAQRNAASNTSAPCQLPKAVPGSASLANLLTQTPPTAATLQASSTVPATVLASATTTASMVTTTTATHVKIGNQIITLTPQQQRQAIQHLQSVKTSEHQPIVVQQTPAGKQALYLKLQQQHQQQQALPPQPPPPQDAGLNTSQPSTTLSFPGGILQIQAVRPAITHLKSIAPAIFVDQANRGVKRPVSTPASRANSLHQQLTTDQDRVLDPSYKSPFKSKQDACKRLLQYHVLSSRMWSEEEIRRDDEHYEAVSKQLLERTSQMLNKYRFLLLRESMKETTTAEKVMLERIFIQEETSSLERDRKAVKEGIELDLPSPPDHWKKKIDPDDTLMDMSKMESPPAKTSVKMDETFIPVIVKQEPADDPTEQLHKVDYGMRCKEEVKDEGRDRGGGGCRMDSSKASRGNHIKNYDEWAEIQKELEMYPIDSEEASPGHMEFDPSDDASHASLDFEPPMSKLLKGGDSEAIQGRDGSYNIQYHQQSHPRHRSPTPHQLHRQVANLLQPPKNQHLDADPSSQIEWGDAFHVISDDEDGCRTSPDEAVGYPLSRREVALDINRTDHHEVMSDLLESTFKSPPSSPLSFSDVIANGSFDRLQDEDLNAQVQSAINSILNLQRIDESRDAFVASIMYQQRHAAQHLPQHLLETATSPSFLTQAHQQAEEYCDGGGMVMTHVSNPSTPVGSDVEEEDNGGGGDDHVDVADTTSRFDFEVRSSADKVNMDGMDYETANIDVYAEDGPSEMDVALDEAVKSILL